jgi:hypothetical protein
VSTPTRPIRAADANKVRYAQVQDATVRSALNE